MTGASREAVQGNRGTIAARGLIGEIMGQGRYRVRAAARSLPWGDTPLLSATDHTTDPMVSRAPITGSRSEVWK